jgi:dipeptidase D
MKATGIVRPVDPLGRVVIPVELRRNLGIKTDDSLEVFVDGDYIGAKGTTLGGDDGIAVAMCLALLDSDEYSHPPLEVLFTSDEEVGMLGADALDVSPLKGKRMINADSEAEGTLWVSCAGGARADIRAEFETVPVAGTVCEISVSGLHGGHSGAEIHNGYRNSNKVLGELLEKLSGSISFNIIDLGGGTADNAITRLSRCVISSDANVENAGREISEEIKENIRCDMHLWRSTCFSRT